MRPTSLFRAAGNAAAGPSKRFVPPPSPARRPQPADPNRPVAAPSRNARNPATRHAASRSSTTGAATAARSSPSVQSSSKGLFRSYMDLSPGGKLLVGGMLAAFAGISYLMDVLGPEEPVEEKIETVFDRRRNELPVEGANPT